MAPNLNKRFVDLLEGELESIRATQEAPSLKTMREVAVFLSLDVTVLSKYRSGDRFVTRKVAQNIAEALRRNGTAQERMELVERFLAAVPEPREADSQARRWITERSALGNLLLAEFREPPAARPRGPHAGLARDVGRSVAEGLCYGLLWPFPLAAQADAKIPGPIRSYLQEIWNGVLETYLSILTEAFRIVCERVARNTGVENSEVVLRSELMNVSDRLRVYVLRDDTRLDFELCPGLGYKLFYIRDKGRKPELHQWFSFETEEKIIQKPPDENEIAAVESRFYPISEFFKHSDPPHMPGNDELKRYADDNPGMAAIGAVPPKSPWEHYEIKLQDMIDKAICG